MKILNVITGLFFIIIDLIKGGFSILIDTVLLFLGQNRKQNTFIKLFMGNCWITFGLVLLVPFFIVGHFSVIAGLIALFASSFFVSEYRKQNYDHYFNDSYESGYDVSGTFITLGLVIAGLLLSNINTAYEYSSLGSTNISKQELTYEIKIRDKENKYTGKTKTSHYRNITMVLNGMEIKVNVSGCKAGKHEIFKEVLPIKYTHLNYLDVDYFADCSKEMRKYNTIQNTKD